MNEVDNIPELLKVIGILSAILSMIFILKWKEEKVERVN